MAVVGNTDIRVQALWPQGDIRDPLGVWGARGLLTGDGSGGSVQANFNVPAVNRDAHVYTCYGATYGQLTGAATTNATKIRLLTNWPNFSSTAGIQGYATNFFATIGTDINMSGTISGYNRTPSQGAIGNADRFILLFTRIGTPLTIVEIEHGANTNLATYAFEVYGYYWDRSVLDAPGGPRHPGSN